MGLRLHILPLYMLPQQLLLRICGLYPVQLVDKSKITITLIKMCIDFKVIAS